MVSTENLHMFNVIEINTEIPYEAWYGSPTGVKERGMLREWYLRTWEFLLAPLDYFDGRVLQPKRSELDG